MTVRSLADLAAAARLRGVDPWFRGLAITGVTADSRNVRPGSLFVAVSGNAADGTGYIADAVARGAAAVLAYDDVEWPDGVLERPFLHCPEPRRALALMAASHAGAAPEKVVAVTGTNGKTSTVDFVRQLWQIAGLRAASLGTLGLVAPNAAGGGGLTTPGPVELADLLARLAQDGVQHVALEASSHGERGHGWRDARCRARRGGLAQAGAAQRGRARGGYPVDLGCTFAAWAGFGDCGGRGAC